MLGGTPRTATDLLGTLLRDVVRKVGETEGQPPQRVVLTHPANWGPFRRGLFEEVPNLAGLVDTITTTEPEAAAAYYASSRRLDDGQTVAIYDLGGGTFDATVLRKRAGGVEILGTPEGIERLGGVDFDDAIMSYVDRTAGGAVFELDMADPQTVVALSRLRQDCTLAKEALSVDTEATIPVFLPSRNFDVRLTRSDFEDMVRRPIESTLGALTRTLDSARVAPAELSAVLLIGGSSRIPLVARMISERFDCQIVVDAHPKYAVALGAATLARAAVTQRSNGHANGHADGIATTEYVRAMIATEFSAQRIPSQTPVPVTAGAAGGPGCPGSADSSCCAGGAGRAVVPVVPAPRLAGPVGLDTLAAAATIEIPAPVRAPQATAPAGRSRWPRPTVPTGRARRLLVAAAVLIIGLAGFAILDRLQAAGLATLPGVASGQPAAAQSIPVPELGPSIPVGATPGFVAVSPDGRQAYVANGNAKFVTVVDTASNALTKTIPVDAGPPQSIAFAPDGRRAYLSIYNQQRSIQAIGVLDTATSKIVASIPLRSRPFVAAVAPDGGRLYVPSYDAGCHLGDRHWHEQGTQGDQGRGEAALGRALAGRIPGLRRPRVQRDLGAGHPHRHRDRADPGRDRPAQRRGASDPAADRRRRQRREHGVGDRHARSTRWSRRSGSERTRRTSPGPRTAGSCTPPTPATAPSRWWTSMRGRSRRRSPPATVRAASPCCRTAGPRT